MEQTLATSHSLIASGGGAADRSAWARLHDLVLRHDTWDLITVLAYTAFTGILALVVPLTAQALVNILVAGVFLQPLVILTGMLLVGLLARGTLRLFKLYLVELLQERIFARVALDVAAGIPLVQHTARTRIYMPEMANRFFDVVTLQKSWAKILLEGPSTVIAILIGSVLLAVYSPYLIAFDVLLLCAVIFVIFVLGLGGATTSIKESKQKYRVAAWLEALGRGHQTFRRQGSPDFPTARADEIVCDYLQARRHHFAVLFRQALGNYLLQALATAGVLGIGGWLVIEKKMSIGQLVAAELVVVSIMSSVEKLIRMAEDVYDLVAGADKIGALLDLPRDPVRSGAPSASGPARVVAQELNFAHEPQGALLSHVSFHIPAGGYACLVGATGSGKTTLALLLAGHLQPRGGRIRGEWAESSGESGSDEPKALLVDCRRDLFEGTVEENLLMGRSSTEPGWLDRVTDRLGLDPLLEGRLGLATAVESEGWNLPGGIVTRIRIARALLERPAVLVLDDALAGLSPREKVELIEAIRKMQRSTLLVIEHDPAVLEKCPQILLIQKGAIRDLGPGAGAMERGLLGAFVGNWRGRPAKKSKPAAREGTES